MTPEITMADERDLPPEGVEMTDDGGAIVQLEDETKTAVVKDFYDNLVEDFDETFLSALSTRLIDAVTLDKKARSQRDKDYTEAIQRTGLGKEAPGGADFAGASKVVHPMLLEAGLDFASRTIRELMPPNGPVKMFIPGENVEPERMKKAERQQRYMNWQCVYQMPELRSEIEQLLSQLPFGGAMYLRITPDYAKRRTRPVPTFVPLDYVSLPAAASNYYTAERQCYWEPVTEEEFKARIREGMYREVPIVTSQNMEESEAQKASDKIEGKDPDPMNMDGSRHVLEISVNEDLGQGDGLAPYLISIDWPSSKVVAIVRNWEQDDQYFDRMQWMTEWIFFQWRGAQGIGLGQAVGSMAGAATGALRALLDSAHISNIPTLARLKGANFSGQSKTVNATQIIEIEGGVGIDADIRKFLMPIPFNGPSETLFKLLGFLTDQGRQAIHVALDKLSENNKNLPVGTTLALIEEGMKVMSSIHLRMFHSMSMFIRILHRINRMYLEEGELKDDTGVVLAHRADFEGPLDCIPTADPEIFSDVQRIAQAQIVADRAAALPQIYNLRATETFLLQRAKIPNPESLLLPEPKAEEMNQVNENVAMTLGRPVTAFPEQDHLSHLQILVDFMMSPYLGQLPIIAPTFMPAALGHMKEHIVLWYANDFYQQARVALDTSDDGMTLVMRERDPETRKELDKTLGAVSGRVLARANTVLRDVPMVIQMAQQIIDAFTPKTLPSDPDKRAAIEQKEASDKRKDATANRKLDQDRENKVIDLQDRREERQRLTSVEFAKLSAKDRQVALTEAEETARQATEHAARLRELYVAESAESERAADQEAAETARNTQDNVTAVRVATAEIESSEKVAESTGTGSDKNPSGARPKG